MAEYTQKLDSNALKMAQDWYIKQLKLSMGVPVPGGWDAVTNPDGSRDNYRGLKPKTETTAMESVGPNETMTSVSRDRNYDSLADYLKDPAAWEKKVRDSIQGWTIGHEDNQQYDFDPEGNFVQQWTHNTKGDEQLLKFAATAAAMAYGANAVNGAGGAGASGAGASGAGAEGAAAADTAKKAWTIKDLTNAVNVAKNPVGAATAAAIGALPSGSKDYLDLYAAITGKRPEAQVQKAVSDAFPGTTKSPTATTDSKTTTQGTQGAKPTTGADTAYGIPLGMLALLGAQGQRNAAPVTLNLNPSTLEFDPFGKRS